MLISIFVGTWTAVAMLVAAATLTTLRTWTTLTFHISLWLLNQNTVRKLEFSCLRIYLQQLHLNLVALFDTSLLNGFQTFPVNLADVKQTILARHEFHEASIGHDAADCTLVNFSYLRNGHDSLNLRDGSIDNFLVGTRYLNLSYSIFLVDGDGSTCFFLHTLDNLSTRTNHCTNELLGDNHLLDTRYMRFQFRTRLTESLHHLH